jgi:hypothetical protein
LLLTPAVSGSEESTAVGKKNKKDIEENIRNSFNLEQMQHPMDAEFELCSTLLRYKHLQLRFLGVALCSPPTRSEAI